MRPAHANVSNATVFHLQKGDHGLDAHAKKFYKCLAQQDLLHHKERDAYFPFKRTMLANNSPLEA